MKLPKFRRTVSPSDVNLMIKEAIDWHQLLLFHIDKTPTRTPLRFKQIHALFLTTGLAVHSHPFSRLLLLSSLPPVSSSLGGDLSYSISLLLHSPRPPSTFLSNTLISSLATSGHHFLALSLFSTISTAPNSHTYPSLLKACSNSSLLLPSGLALHAHLLKTLSFPLDPVVLTSLVFLHSRRGRHHACRHLFDQIPNPDLPAWNAILTCSAAKEVLSLFPSFQLSSSLPNEITLLSLIVACGDLSALTHGIWAHAYINRSSSSRRLLVCNHFLGAALIDMYSNCGRLDFAHQVFARLPQKDTFCYNAMMRGLATHGDGHGALALFNEIIREGIQPDEVTFLMAMSACSHAGLVDDGCRFFDRMEAEFGISPKLEHYGCLVGILGRAGELKEADKVMGRMPMEPNGMLLRALLGAFRIHHRLKIDEKVMNMLMELEPNNGENYVLLSNIYANFGKWDGAVQMRKKMRERGLGKRAGLSGVEIDGVVEEFVNGDQSHPQKKEIYEMIDQISRRFHD
ncbi:pentatricopeptide repeat-containing protein At5g43790-like [Phalaenopsis equestris]|uniref:pentatricopeptide repeat-containing protein At5g43790-like n=1 Tax=Phalaenopsis equestris TaxID=78828 RepID=UPI0009E23889|nr:pentatricopeptide repeat-containing protein At5g43790-like [Phalaenopsis equestris]